MKEKDIKAIENCSLEQLFVMDEFLDLEENRGVDTTEVKDKVWEVINKKLKEEEQPKEINRYEDCTKEELTSLLQSAQRLEDEGLSLTKTIIKIESALEDKVDSGIIYESSTPHVRKEDAV